MSRAFIASVLLSIATSGCVFLFEDTTKRRPPPEKTAESSIYRDTICTPGSEDVGSANDDEEDRPVCRTVSVGGHPFLDPPDEPPPLPPSDKDAGP